MKVTRLDMDQRTDEWLQARLGRLTASRASDMLATRKDGKPSASRTNLRVQLMLERINQRSYEREFQSPSMLDGIAREAEALTLYELQTGHVVRPCGFLRADELMVGASLDGFVDDDGIVEAKCPLPATHLEYLKTGRVPADYVAQIWHQLWLSDRRWADWLSYNPDFPEPLRTKIVRVPRDEAAIAAYAQKALAFLAEVDAAEREVREMVARA